MDAFNEATPGRKLMLALIAVLPIAALVGVYLWLNQPPYRTLFPRLSDQSGGEVMAALEQLDITYRLAENDGTIQVPANQLYSARFQLAARGLPKSDTQGYPRNESGPTFGLSQFQEQLRYQHALESELVRSVETLEAVASARVHLALPKVSPFLRDPPPVTAAVLLQLKSQHSLTPEQVVAVQHMVAASVPRLKATDVSVLDPQGQLLGVVGSGPDIKRATLEADLTQRVIHVLNAWLGTNKTKAQITATLAPDGRLRRVNATVMLTQQPSNEVISQASTLAREALGFDAQRGDTTTPIADEAVMSDAERFDALLQASRHQTLDNPRVTADVIRMWMRA